EVVLRGELVELWAPRRGAVFVQDFANHASRHEPGEPREIDGRLGVADTLQHATLTRAKREDVAAVPQIARDRRWIDGDANGRCAVLRADARRHTKARRR